MSLGALARHSMRAYAIPVAASCALIVSAFLPWVILNNDRIAGIPGIAGLWVLGLGALGLVLAILSFVTKKNSRHPLLVVGLAALGVLFVNYEVLAKIAARRAWASAQALAIVDGVDAPIADARAVLGSGIYLGLAASVVLVLFGLTVVVKRVRQPYAADEDAQAPRAFERE